MLRQIKWQQNNKEKERAARAARYAIKTNKLIPKPCERCGEMDGIQAHHEDYSRPYDIMWLCHVHHKERHKEINAGSAPIIRDYEPVRIKKEKLPKPQRHAKQNPTAEAKIRIYKQWSGKMLTTPEIERVARRVGATEAQIINWRYRGISRLWRSIIMKHGRKLSLDDLGLLAPKETK